MVYIYIYTSKTQQHAAVAVAVAVAAAKAIVRWNTSHQTKCTHAEQNRADLAV